MFTHVAKIVSPHLAPPEWAGGPIKGAQEENKPRIWVKLFHIDSGATSKLKRDRLTKMKRNLVLFDFGFCDQHLVNFCKTNFYARVGLGCWCFIAHDCLLAWHGPGTVMPGIFFPVSGFRNTTVASGG